MPIKSHVVNYSLGRGQAAPGYLIAENDAILGSAFRDPMGRLTFATYDARLKELEKLVFRTIEEIEGSLMTYLEGRGATALGSAASHGTLSSGAAAAAVSAGGIGPDGDDEDVT